MPLDPRLMYEESELEPLLSGGFDVVKDARKAGTIRHLVVNKQSPQRYYLGGDVIDHFARIGAVEAKSLLEVLHGAPVDDQVVAPVVEAKVEPAPPAPPKPEPAKAPDAPPAAKPEAPPK